MSEEDFKTILRTGNIDEIINALDKLMHPTKLEHFKNVLKGQINSEIIERNYDGILESVDSGKVILLLQKLSELETYEELQDKYFNELIKRNIIDLKEIVGKIYLPTKTIKPVIESMYIKAPKKHILIKKLIETTRNISEIKQLIDMLYEECIYDVVNIEEELIENILMYIKTTRMELEEIKQYLIEKMNENLNKLSIKALINLMESELVDHKKLSQVIDENKTEVLFYIIKYKTLSYGQSISSDKDVQMLQIIFEEILKNENKNVSDIKFDEGAFSKVFIIGDKVIKIGKRNTFNIKYNKRFLKPILRKLFTINGIDICVEITERVIVGETITEEELYKIYKELRNKGIYWGDCSIDNVGRLTKSNKIYFGESIYYNDENCGYIRTEESDIELQSGELVIIDNDYIYEDTISDIKMQSTTESYKFEKRYKKEKSKHN